MKHFIRRNSVNSKLWLHFYLWSMYILRQPLHLTSKLWYQYLVSRVVNCRTRITHVEHQNVCTNTNEQICMRGNVLFQWEQIQIPFIINTCFLFCFTKAEYESCVFRCPECYEFMQTSQRLSDHLRLVHNLCRIEGKFVTVERYTFLLSFQF